MGEPVVEITLDKVRHLRLDLNAMEDFEKATNKSAFTLGDGMNAADMKALLWACLRQEEPTLLPSDVGAMISLAKVPYVANLLAGLFRDAMPKEKKPSPLARGRRPTG